jgi:hypothetical protein
MERITGATIIQRFWRSFREEGIVGIGRKLDGECFAFLREQRYDSVDMVEFAAPDMICLFQKWLLKIFQRTGVPSAEHLLAKDSHVLLCFFVELFKSKFTTAGSPSDLVGMASRLVANLLSLMEGHLDGIRRIGAEVSEFVRLFGVWHSSFFRQFIVQLRGDVIHLIFMSNMRGDVVSELLFSRFRSSLVMYTLMDPEAANLKSSPVYRAIQMTRNSKYSVPATDFWNRKVMHEFIIERRLEYRVPLEKTLPFLLTDHSRAGLLVDSPSLRDDLMCLMILFANQGNLMELVSETFQANKDCNTTIFSFRTMELLLHVVSSSSAVAAIRAEWDAKKDHHPLETLVLAVRMERNLSENRLVNLACPSVQMCMNPETFIPTVGAYHVLKAEKFDRTCAWITSFLEKCTSDELRALSVSNPFAFHGFFNKAMLNLVLDNGSRDLLGDTLLPEFLVHDQERLRDIRFEFSLRSFDARHLMEFISSGRWIGHTAPTPAFLQIAVKFQRIIKLGFWVHGDCARCSATLGARMKLGSS